MKSSEKSLFVKLIPFFGAAAIAVTDLYIKKKMEEELPAFEAQGKKPKKGFLMFNRYHNKGAFLNIGEKKPEKVTIATSLACGGVFGGLLGAVKKGSFLEKIGYMICLGGAASNTYDRVTKGYVVDYVSLDVKPKRIRNIVFNLSDVCIFVGAIIVMITNLIPKKK